MEGYGDDWKTVVEKGKEKERNEESMLICDYFMHSSVDRERRSLDDKRVKWIARRMEMITEETKERFQGKMGVEYRVDRRTVEKKPATMSPPGMIEYQLFLEQCMMELLLLYEVKEWEQLFWNKFKALLDQIGNDRVEVKERLTREWRADCWKRLSSQMHVAENRLADLKDYNKDILDSVIACWVSSISRFFEGVERPTSISLREVIQSWITAYERGYPHYEMRALMENEMEDIEFRLKRGSELGRFDQFWDDDTLFECRYSRSKWLYLSRNVPLEVYLHALKRNKNIIHITFDRDFDVTRFPICDLPWVTSISSSNPFTLPAIHDGPLFIRSNNNDLITFAKEIRPKLDPFSTYIFTDAGSTDIYSDKLGNNARVLISFVAPTSGQSLILRLKHSGDVDVPLEVISGSTVIQLNPSSKSSITIDDITLHPIPGPSDHDHLSFYPGRNVIFIQFRGTAWGHGHLLHDIELLDEAGLKNPGNQIMNAEPEHHSRSSMVHISSTYVYDAKAPQNT